MDPRNQFRVRGVRRIFSSNPSQETQRGRGAGFPWWAWALAIAVPMGLLVNRLLKKRAAQPKVIVIQKAASAEAEPRVLLRVVDTPVESIPPVVQEVPLPPKRAPRAAEQAEAAAPVAPKAPTDDLMLIEGIGPVIAEVLHKAGINTFSQLAETDASRLRQILRDAKIRLSDPSTWPEQARLAAAGDWVGLRAFTDQLKAGRRE